MPTITETTKAPRKVNPESKRSLKAKASRQAAKLAWHAAQVKKALEFMRETLEMPEFADSSLARMSLRNAAGDVQMVQESLECAASTLKQAVL